MFVSHNSKRQKRQLKNQGEAVAGETEKNGGFKERRTSFTLESWEIRPSAVVGIRREAALRGEGFVWVQDLRSFDKLREVGVSPYLGFILYLSVFTMFELIEAVSGRLIGPKTWDRIVRIFLSPLYAVRGS